MFTTETKLLIRNKQILYKKAKSRNTDQACHKLRAIKNTPKNNAGKQMKIKLQTFSPLKTITKNVGNTLGPNVKNNPVLLTCSKTTHGSLTQKQRPTPLTHNSVKSSPPPTKTRTLHLTTARGLTAHKIGTEWKISL